MIATRTLPRARRATRTAIGLLGVAVGLGIVTTVVESLGARSGGQSLGAFVATQRATTNHPLAQVTVPAALESPAAAVLRDAV